MWCILLRLIPVISSFIGISRQQGLFKRVYVDSRRGNDDYPSCGEYLLHPCKSLKKAVERAECDSIIHISGDQVLSESIVLKKNITISSSDPEKARITRRHNKPRFAFELSKKIKLSLNNLRFLKIGILNMINHSEAVLRKISSSYCPTTMIKIKKIAIPTFSLYIISSTFSNSVRITNSPGKQRSSDKEIERFNSTVIMKNSIFRNTGPMRLVRMSVVIVRNCTFDSLSNKENGGALSINGARKTRITSSVFRNSIVGNKGGFVHFQVGMDLEISNCKFYNGRARTSGGALYLNQVRKLVVIKDCIFHSSSSTQGGAIALLNVENKGQIQRCKFLSNEAKIGGAVYINAFLLFRRNWRLSDCQKKSLKKCKNDCQGLPFIFDQIKFTLENCTFTANKAISVGQAIYANEKLRLENIKLKGLCNTSSNHVQLEGRKVILKNIDMKLIEVRPLQSSLVSHSITVTAENINVRGLYVTCPRHFNIVKEMIRYEGKTANHTLANITTLLIGRCEACHANQYTLNTGRLTVYTMGNISKTNPRCIPCPPGAKCRGDIHPIDNFWGYVVSDTEIKFLQCPVGYCCSSQSTPCTNYKTCKKGRTGNLCGSCDVGYFQSVLTTDCIKKSKVECDFGLFLVSFVVGSLLFTAIFTFLAPVVQIVKNHVRSVERPNTQVVNAVVEENGAALIEAQGTMNDEDKGIPISAFITIIYLFFQVSSIVHVKTRNQAMLEEGSMYKEVLFAFFNFQVSFYKEICPTNNLTLVSKEFINIILKLCSILNLFIFYIFWKLWAISKSFYSATSQKSAEGHRSEPCIPLTIENHTAYLQANNSVDEKDNNSPTFDAMLKIGFIKLVKLNFTSISKFALRMIHCVTINGSLYLYTYADMKCYTCWQYVIMFVIIPVIILFPASFSMALNLLKEEYISTRSFLIASVIPFYTFFLYGKKRLFILKKYQYSKDEKTSATRILQIEEIIFNEDDNSLRWPVVQLYRNLIVVIVDILLKNPTYRIILFVPLFVVFLVHDRYRMPYKHPYLNYLQSQSSTFLIVITACNIPASFTIMTNIMVIPNMRIVLVVLKYVETVIYILMPMSLIGWKIWERCLNSSCTKKNE